MKADLLTALDLLPHYENAGDGKWIQRARFCMTSNPRLPRKIERSVNKIMDQIDALGYQSKIEWVDVSGNNIFVLHSSLKRKTLRFLARNGFSWQRWKRSRLPVYIRYEGKLIIWNGTHRMTICKLTGRKVRARVLDFNKFIEWKKTHPYGNARVLTFGGKRRGNRK